MRHALRDGVSALLLAVLVVPTMGAETARQSTPPTGTTTAPSPPASGAPLAAPPASPASARTDRTNQQQLGEDTFRLAMQIWGTLRDVRIAVANQGIVALDDQTNKAIQQIADLQTSAVGDADAATLRGQFEAFQQTWQSLHVKLNNLPNLLDWAVVRIERVDSDTRMLARLLSVTPTPTYDTVKVSKLANKLVESTAFLAESMKTSAIVPTAREAARQRYSEQLHRQADSLAVLVSDGAGLVTVSEAFRDFDTTWQLFLSWTEFPMSTDQRVQVRVPEIWDIDRQLYRELMVNSPAYSPKQRFDNLAVSIANMASRLPPTLLRESMSLNQPDVITYARLFDQEASAFRLWVEQQTDTPSITDPKAESLMSSWRRFNNFMSGVSWAGAPVSHQIVENIAGDTKTLFTLLKRP